MSKHTLQAQPRELSGRKVKQLRSQGFVPANVFGKKVESLQIQVDAKVFSKIYTEVGESTLIYLQVAGEKQERPVLVREIAIHPTTSQYLHVSFHQVDLKEKVTAPVKVVLEGEAPAEKEKLGILVQQLDQVEIEALPTEMPENITLDISGLSQVDDSITVADLRLSPNLSVQTDPDAVIVKIEALAAEEPAEVAPVEGEETAAETTTVEGEGETAAAEPAPEE